MTEDDVQDASKGGKLEQQVSLLPQESVDSGYKDAESSLSSTAFSPLKLCSGLEPFRDDPDAPKEPPRVSTQQGTDVASSPPSSPSSVGNGLSEHPVAKTQPGYRETQLAPGASLVVGCESEVQATVDFPAHAPRSGDVAKDHNIMGLEEKLEIEKRNRKELEEQLELVTNQKEELEAQLKRVKQSCEFEVHTLQFDYDSKCKELETCRLKLAEKEQELDGLNEHWSKEVKQAKAEADRRVRQLKEEHDCKVSELKKEAEEKDHEQYQLQIQIERTKRECDNKVKDLEMSIEVKRREIAEKDKDLALKGAEISRLESELIVRREKEEKEALCRSSKAVIEALKKDNASLKDQLHQYKTGDSMRSKNSCSEHSDYM